HVDDRVHRGGAGLPDADDVVLDEPRWPGERAVGLAGLLADAAGRLAGRPAVVLLRHAHADVRVLAARDLPGRAVVVSGEGHGVLALPRAVAIRDLAGVLLDVGEDAVEQHAPGGAGVHPRGVDGAAGVARVEPEAPTGASGSAARERGGGQPR